jgi:hypothetical protein
MSGFDQLGRELESADGRGRARSWSRRAGGVGGIVALAAALATVVVIVVGAVVLLHGRSAPTTAGSATQGAPSAQVAAWTRALSCSRPGRAQIPRFARPVLTDAAPDPRLLAVLGVLRRPWTAEDAAPTAGCALSWPLPPMKLDISFVRYVGPGVHGGKVFLVPGLTMALRLPPAARESAAQREAIARFDHQPEACLMTIGGASPAGGLGQICWPVSMIKRPLAGTFFPAEAPRMVRGIALKLCRQVEAHAPTARDVRARLHAACLNAMLHPRPVRLPRLVMSGVVRDGITSVSVYSRGKRVLTVPVHNNAYTFETGGAVVGQLRLVFTDARGRAVPTSPIHFGTAISSARGTVPARAIVARLPRPRAITVPSASVVAPSSSARTPAAP